MMRERPVAWDQLLGDHLAVLHASVTEGDIDTVGDEAGGPPLVQQQLYRYLQVGLMETVQQWRDDPTADPDV